MTSTHFNCFTQQCKTNTAEMQKYYYYYYYYYYYDCVDLDACTYSNNSL